MTDLTNRKDFYMSGLDGLRALAVFAVIAYHLGLPFVPGGFLGVTLFFVLSGYLITDLLLSEWTFNKKINFKDFFVRRAKRLLPGMLFLLICISAYITAFRPDLLANLKSAILPATFFFSNWWYIFQDVPYFATFAAPSLLNHFWSLAVEAQFYVIWPLLLLFGQRFFKKKWLNLTLIVITAVLSAVLMAILYKPGFDPSRIYYGTDTRVFSLLLGAGLALVYPSIKIAQSVPKKKTSVILDLVGFSTLLLILFMTYFITQYDDFLYLGGMFLFSVASVLLIAAVANPYTIISKVLSFRPLRFIGKISYGVYLWQFPVIVITNSMVHLSEVNIALSIFQVAVTILFATVSYYLVEKPLRKKNIIQSLKENSFRDFCKSCLRTRWWEKTTALLVMTLVLVSGFGFSNASAEPNTDSNDLSALPSQIVIIPSNNIDVSSAPPISSPTANDSAATVSPSSGQANPTQGSDSPASSQSPDESPSQDPGLNTSTTPDSSPSTTPAVITPSDLCITVIGDSIAIDIAPYLQTYYPKMHLDAEVGRQFYQAKNIITQLIQKNELASVVVIELGSNGTFSEAQMRSLIDLIGSDIKIVFINTQVPRSWCSTVNNTLSKVSAEYSNTTVADWYSVSVDMNDYFYNDGFHPNKTGSPIMAKVIADAITKIQPYKPYIPIP